MTIASAPAASAAPPAQALDRAAFGREWEDWHRAHEARRADPHGFLAVTGLLWLSPEPTAFEGIPGVWSTGPDGPVVELELGAGETIVVDGARVEGRHSFGVIAERGGLVVGFDGGVIEVAKRGGHDILRPRRADHPFLAVYS